MTPLNSSRKYLEESEDIPFTPNYSLDIEEFRGQGAIAVIDDGLSDAEDRDDTTEALKRVQSSFSFFNPTMHPVRKRIVLHAIGILMFMGCYMMAILSLYWGAMFHKTDHLKYMDYAVFIEDESTPLVIGDAVMKAVLEMGNVGTWTIYTPQNISLLKPHADLSGEETIKDLVHRQKVWGGIHVKKDASKQWAECISNNTKAGSLVTNYYQSGRDPQTVPLYVVPNFSTFETRFTLLQGDVIQGLGLSKETLADGISVASTPILVNNDDMLPLGSSTVAAPTQVGYVFMIIITFFQFNFFMNLNQEVAATKMKKPHYLLYRVAMANFAYFWLLLLYSLVSLAFQIDMNRAFGRAGFVVYWMTNWMTMVSVGNTTEVMAHIFIMLWPPLLGFWLISWVIANVAPTFTPMILTANYYRYGYFIPIHNTAEITKVIFFNTWRGLMGRSYGILCAWVVVSNIALVLIIPVFGKVMGGRSRKEKQLIIDKYEKERKEV